MQIYALIKRIHEGYRMQENRKLKAFGLTVTQAEALAFITESPDVVTQKDLERRMGITHSAAVSLVSRLEAKGLICCVTKQEDRRQKLLIPTETGKQTEQELTGYETDAEAELLRILSREELDQLEALLRRIYQNQTETSFCIKVSHATLYF